MGVGSGVGEQQRLVVVSTTTGVVRGGVSEVATGDGTMAIAVVMRCARTQPTMRSRCDWFSCGMRKR